MGPAFRRTGTLAAIFLFMAAQPNAGYAARIEGTLQCVPYARTVSDIRLTGDAWTWWEQAEGRYARGGAPRKGAVMVLAPAGPMNLGHVAVVSKVLDAREVLIRHANWSSPGAIEEDVLARDVSPEGDWSQVRIWHSPSGKLGVRSNPVYGFIYAPEPKLRRFDPARDVPLGTRYAVLRAEGADAPVAALRPAAVQAPARLAYAFPAWSDEVSGGRGAPRPAAAKSNRTLADIIADVKKSAKIG